MSSVELVNVHKSYDLLAKMSYVKSFKDKMEEVVTTEVARSRATLADSGWTRPVRIGQSQ